VAGQLGKNDVTRGQATALACHLTKKVNKAEKLTSDTTYINELTFLPTNSGCKNGCEKLISQLLAG